MEKPRGSQKERGEVHISFRNQAKTRWTMDHDGLFKITHGKPSLKLTKRKRQETSITPIIPWTPRDTHHYEKKKNVNGNCPPSCSIRNLTWQQFGAAKQYQGAIACVDT
jgi:hypothetical protein